MRNVWEIYLELNNLEEEIATKKAATLNSLNEVKNNIEENITNKILCLPMTIGSTTGGLVIQTVCSMHINPRAFLFSEPIDSLAASGIVLSKVWQNSDIICIDCLGKEFLDTVKQNDKIEIKEDGTVIILD